MATSFPVGDLPTTEELSAAFVAFHTTMCQVAHREAGKARIEWIAERAEQLATEFSEGISTVDFDEIVAEFSGRSAIALRIIIEEMNHFAERYDVTLTPATPVDANGQPLEAAQSSESRVAEDAETVVGSIEKLFKRLPVWMQRLLDVGLELLKLSSGRV